MICAKIVIQLPGNIPDFYKEPDGTVILDLDERFAARLSNQLEALTEVGKIKTEAILGTSLPSTPKNDFFMRPIVLANRVDPDFKPIQVLLVLGSRILRQKDLYVLDYTSADGYEVQFKNGQQHWSQGAKDKALCKVKLTDDEKFEFTKNNIIDQNLLGPYEDGQIGVRFALANYGQFVDKKVTPPLISPNYIGIPDLRPLLSELWVLRRSYFELGWDFQSSILESDYGRRQFDYLLAKDFGSDAAVLDSRRFEAILTNDKPWTQADNFNSIAFNESFDPSGLYDPLNGWYSGSGISDMKSEFILKVTSNILAIGSGLKLYATARLIMETSLGATMIDFVTNQLDLSAAWVASGVPMKSEFKFDHSDFQLDTDGFCYITFEISEFPGAVIGGVDSPAFNFSISQGGRFYNDPKQIFITAGDKFNFESLIDPSYNLLDYTKGVAHKFAAKFLTDFNTNTIYMFPTYNGKIWDEEMVEGFFIEDLSEDITLITQENSDKITTPNRELKRYHLLKWKGNGDKAVEKLKLPEDKPYLSYKVDFGSQFIEETDTNENPFFEVTVNDYYSDYQTYNVNMPFMIDNEASGGDKVKLSYDLGPRTLYWAGMVGQVFLTPNGYRPARIVMFGQETILFPTAYQFSDANYGTVAVHAQTQINVAYGEHPTLRRPNILNKDLFHFFWQRWLSEFRFNLAISLLVLIKHKDYNRFNFRKAITFYSLGRTVTGRLLEINDFDACNNISTPFIIMPIRQSLDACYGLPNDGGGGTNPCIGNAPILIITESGNCFIFSMGGASNSPIETVIFEWKYLDDTLWTASNMACDVDRAFEVRMIVDYSDSCPSITRRRIVDACGNSPTVTLSYDYQNFCFNTIIGGLTGSVIASIDAEYSEDDGETWTSYNYNDCIPTLVNHIMVRLTVNYADNCPPIDITAELIIPPVVPDCGQTNADAECDEAGFVIKTGAVAGPVALDIIEWRFPGTDEWFIWDNVTPLPCPFEFRRVIFFCNNECPTYCGPIHLCECVAPCNVVVTNILIDPPTIENDMTLSTTAIYEGCFDDPVTFQWFIKDIGDGDIDYTDSGLGSVNPALWGPDFPGDTSGNLAFKVIVSCGGCSDELTTEFAVECETPPGSPNNITICNDI